MSYRDFIKDVIYGLKVEYGSPAGLEQKSIVSLDLDTGGKSEFVTSKYIDKVIPLPLFRRNEFLKAVGIHQNEAIITADDKQFLLDVDDLGAFVVTPEITTLNDMVVKRIENYEYAMIVTTRQTR